MLDGPRDLHSILKLAPRIVNVLFPLLGAPLDGPSYSVDSFVVVYAEIVQ